MSESLSIDQPWEEPLPDSEQVTHVKGDPVADATAAGEWLVNVSEEVVVPMTTTNVVEALRLRRITDRSLVWRVGMQDWTALGDVPPLRLAAGELAAPPRRTLRPPPKEQARAARDERHRRSTLPFGFPVVRDPATIREPEGLVQLDSGSSASEVALAAAVPPATVPGADEVQAFANYDRATPSLTSSDAAGADWEAITGRRTPPLPLEPESEHEPRLALELQSDPGQSTRVDPAVKVSRSQPPNSLAPTTFGAGGETKLPARSAGLWGDLRAVKASSMRIALAASIGSALLASLLTLWVAHSAKRPAREPALAAQPQAAPAPVKAEEAPAAAVVVLPVAPVVSVLPSTTSPASAQSSGAASARGSATTAVRPSAKPASSSAPRVVSARPKRAATPASPASAPAIASLPDPSAQPVEPDPPKAPTAAFKETGSAPAPKPEANSNVQSGLEDNAKPLHLGPAATPGF